MSTPYRRLFETSLAALLLADCDEEELPATAQARNQWPKSRAKDTLQAGSGESAPTEGEGAPLS